MFDSGRRNLKTLRTGYSPCIFAAGGGGSALRDCFGVRNANFDGYRICYVRLHVYAALCAHLRKTIEYALTSRAPFSPSHDLTAASSPSGGAMSEPRDLPEVAPARNMHGAFENSTVTL